MLRKAITAAVLALSGTTAFAAAATAAPADTTAQVSAMEAEWVDMGHYGPGYEQLCYYHRDTYRAIGRPAECLANGNGVTLWVWF